MYKPSWVLSCGIFLVGSGCGALDPNAGDQEEPKAQLQNYALRQNETFNLAGAAETAHTSGVIDTSNPFFLVRGTNPRTCETCHAASQGWTISAMGAATKFYLSDGLDPLFNLVDTGSRPDADVSTSQARRETFDSTIDRAVIRFTRTINPAAEFAVAAVSDPSGFSDTTRVSAFRRPSPTANESKVPNTGWAGGPATAGVPAALAATAVGATRLHGQRVEPLSPEDAAAERDFMFGVIFAQSYDWLAGRLDADGARGGAQNLMAQPFYEGINDITGGDPQGHPFNRKVFNIFDAWENEQPSPTVSPWQAAARASIYRGQELFNSYEFTVSDVKGLNDVLGQPVAAVTCSTCHNTPNVGGHSVFRQFDIGSANEENCGAALPILTLQNKTTGETRKVCDMGRATGSGLWNDIGKFRAPPLRGLAARAPYFHDGQMGTIWDVVQYYDRHFSMGLSTQQKLDLTAFLRAL